MHGRIYTIYPEAPPTGVTAPRDLISFQVGAAKMVRILWAKAKQESSEEGQQIAFRLACVAAFGSGGATTGISVRKHDPGSAAHGFQTLRINDTTPAAVAAHDTIWRDAEDVRAGVIYEPTDLAQWLIPGQRVAFSMLEAPGAAGGLTIFSSITVEEVG